MSTSKQFTLKDEEDTLDFGAALARATFLNPDDAQTKSGEPGCRTMGAVIYLLGDLGAGKTTLTRGFLRGFGFHGAVKSPTYTLVEPYEFSLCKIYHFDLYRVNDPQELDYIGFTDYLDNGALNIVEWPEQGSEYLNKTDIHLSIEHRSSGRSVIIESRSEADKKFIEGFVDCRFFIDHAMID